MCKLILLLLAFAALPSFAVEPLKVLYITGGGGNDYTSQAALISQGLQERANVKVTVFQDPGTTTASKIKVYEDANWAAPYDLIIHNECCVDTKDPAWTQRILQPHKEGKPGVVIHCAMHCYPDGTDEWFKFCGVTSRRHGGAYSHEVRNMDAAHPVMQGWGPAWANPAGELYWIETIWPDTHPLCESKNHENGKSEVCVWTNQYIGKTRVFGTTLGHHNETVSDGKFLDLIARGVLWSADKLNGDYLKVVGTETKAAKSTTPDDEKVLRDVRAPKEFDVSVFATPPAVNYPVYVAAAPDGTLFVSSDKNGSLDRKPFRGSIIRLKDLDGDGRADQSNLYVADVDSPRGAVWDHDRLYLVHPPHLSAFIDHNGDGVSDEEKILVKNIAFGFKDRPADHTTNGLTLGIDGWLYIAGGDFGFVEAEGTDGRKLQHRGGGVIRVRPDGTELQIYSTGTRNILDVAMSPALDAFCRDNTNDGGGWDIRFHHFTGLDDHGYPRLFVNFPGEHIKPLAEYGGGSGCGGCYLNEPGFPERYADLPLTCDWGRSFIFSHHVTPNGATFKDDCREFIGMTRVTDVDVDANSRLYAASWRGASFTYEGENVGYIVQVKPKGYTPEPLPDFDKASEPALVSLLKSPSARRRLEAQRELVRRGISAEAAYMLGGMAGRLSPPLATRIACLFTLKQALGRYAAGPLESLAAIESIQGWAIRAMADRENEFDEVSAATLQAGCAALMPRTKLEAAVAIARSGKVKYATALLPLLGDDDAVIAHTAFRCVALLKAHEACFTVIDTNAPYPQRAGALLALMRMHEPAVVEGLIARIDKETDSARRRGLLGALCRLHFREGPWKGDSWGTRPDTRGPYYQPEKWSESDKIMAALKSTLSKAQDEEAGWLAMEMTRNRIEDDSTLKQLLTLAAGDAKLRSSLISQLVKKDTVPHEAVALLTNAATAPDTAANERADAIAILTKTDNADAWHALPQALSSFGGRRGRQGGGRAAQAFLSAPKLENFHAYFEELAAKVDGASSQWADAALLTLSARTTGSPEAREQSAKALEAGWPNMNRRAQILTAIAEIKHRPWASRVLASLSDPDKSVATAADRAVRALKLDPAEASAPKIETMKPEDVIAAVLKTKGDAAVGAQIFQQATCANCHTVSKDAPPKGPFLGNIAETYKRPDLAESILNPNKTIAQGFVTNFFILKQGDPEMGFVVQESAGIVTIRNQAGIEKKIAAADIKERQPLPNSMMPPGLMNQMTVKDFASLLDYLEQLAKEGKK